VTRPASQPAVAKAGEALTATIGQEIVNDLRVHAHSRKFWVHSATHPDHEYWFHFTDSDKLALCPSHAISDTTLDHASCEYILALKIVQGI
jgi:hypothetical protein